MRDAPKQLAFDLPLDPRYGREDFLVSPSNERAYALVERWPDWPDTILHITGPEGSGKSHLASIWATTAHAWTIDAFEVSGDRVPHLVSNGALVVDYVALRIERSLSRAAEIVSALDREALSRGRRITRAMAAEVLGQIPEM